MNEVLADVYSITGDEKYLRLARRFSHREILDPLLRHEDRLTGRHANTQIPKVIGLQRIAALTGDQAGAAGARFFWETVTQRRSVAFGGNSVAEHFNDPSNFRGLLEHREGPETCNTYNMLRLTEQLFSEHPEGRLADFYERALYNHILASLNPRVPGYVYFTPIRPAHYRVYSQPEQGFWCCVGSGMENPGKYGQFIYATSPRTVWVNLFIASELRTDELTLRQETHFPDEERTSLLVSAAPNYPVTFQLRHPQWLEAQGFSVALNGQPLTPAPSPIDGYVSVTRTWNTGDRLELTLPMRSSVERLPDGSPWFAFFHGPILLAQPVSGPEQTGLRAGAGRGDHVARGPLVPMEQSPVLLTDPTQVLNYLHPEPSAGPLHFRLQGAVYPENADGLPLRPFFRLHDTRYQLYWEATTREGLAERQARLAAAEKARLAREAATLDAVAIGEQQSEVDHAFVGQGTEAGEFNGRRWRHGPRFAYTLRTQEATEAVLVITLNGGDRDRTFSILANGYLLATAVLRGESPGNFIDRHYTLPPEVLRASGGQLTVEFVAAPGSVAGGLFDLRLLRSQPSPAGP